jgi:hypothetical protein
MPPTTRLTLPLPLRDKPGIATGSWRLISPGLLHDSDRMFSVNPRESGKLIKDSTFL